MIKSKKNIESKKDVQTGKPAPALRILGEGEIVAVSGGATATTPPPNNHKTYGYIT